MRAEIQRPVMPIEDDEHEAEAEKQLHDKLQVAHGIYIGDVDKMLESVEKQMPIVETEQIYLWELDKQGRIYLAFVILGIMMVALGLLI